MGELEEKLNNILSSPADMEKILGLARELSGSKAGGKPSSEKSEARDGLLGSLGSLDPKVIGMVSRLMGEYSSASSDKAALVSSIKPYIREERREELDRAVKIAKAAHVARIALSEFSGGEFNINL